GSPPIRHGKPPAHRPLGKEVVFDANPNRPGPANPSRRRQTRATVSDIRTGAIFPGTKVHSTIAPPTPIKAPGRHPNSGLKNFGRWFFRKLPAAILPSAGCA